MQVHGGETVGSLDALRRVGIKILTVAPYRWTLPEDLAPALAALIRRPTGPADRHRSGEHGRQRDGLVEMDFAAPQSLGHVHRDVRPAHQRVAVLISV